LETVKFKYGLLAFPASTIIFWLITSYLRTMRRGGLGDSASSETEDPL
jgi:hypothetical protein